MDPNLYMAAKKARKKKELEKIAKVVSLSDPVSLLKKDRRLLQKLKKTKMDKEDEIRLLLQSNKKMVELIEVLNDRVEKMTQEMQKHYKYSYERGGWVEKKSVNKSKVEFDEKLPVTVERINGQIEEIMRLIRLNKT